MKKTTQEVLQKAADLKVDIVEFFRRALDGFGDETDQLRVLGHACQALVELAQNELEAIRLQDEVEHPKSRLILPSWKN